MRFNKNLKLYIFNLLTNSNINKINLNINILLLTLNDYEALYETKKFKTLTIKFNKKFYEIFVN